MNSGGRLNQSNVVRPTILCSLIFTGSKMLRDAVLDTVILFLVVQTDDCVVELLHACDCWQIDFMEELINAWGVHFLYFLLLFKIYINVRVQLLHFSSAFLICSSRFSLQSWMLWLLLICAIFDKFLVVLVAQNGNSKVSFLLFSIVNKRYDHYEARTVIGLFWTNELFSHHFRGFKLEIFDPRNVRKPIQFSVLFLTSTS